MKIVKSLCLNADNDINYMKLKDPLYEENDQYFYHIDINNIEEFLSFWELRMDEDGFLFNDKEKCVGKIE